MKELKNLILSAQQHDNEAMMKIIAMFDPCISKYTKMMNYDEDTRSDLTLFLIELVLSMNISKIHNPDTPVLIKYISLSLYRKYTRLSSARKLIQDNEKSFEHSEIEEWLCIDYEMQEALNSIIYNAFIKEELTEKEYTCIKLTVIEDRSSTEASRLLGITRQTANETKLRALRKLKKSYEN